MNKKICHREKEVQEWLKTGKGSPKIQNHITDCPVCQDHARVQEWMNRFKEKAWETDMPGKILPDAASVWNRVHTVKRFDKKLVRKAMRPLIIPQALSIGIFIAGIVYMMVWGFRKFGYILDNPVVSQLLPFFGILMVIVMISLSFCAVVALFDRHKHPI